MVKNIGRKGDGSKIENKKNLLLKRDIKTSSNETTNFLHLLTKGPAL